jgi:2-oxoglutarate ferredoxin oxidoreductase subunit alpha
MPAPGRDDADRGVADACRACRAVTAAAPEQARVSIRFAGDSGDGVQLTGGRFAEVTGLAGNDLMTWPDFPAEIRAPAGTVEGVSAFQISFGSTEVSTPGDRPAALVAMNPAALRANIGAMAPGSTILVNEDGFTASGLRKAGYDRSPLDDEALSAFSVVRVPMTSLATRACEAVEGVSARSATRSKNFFALGLVSWLFDRPLDPTIRWIERRFADDASSKAANLAALRAGYSFGDTAELLPRQVRVPPAPARAGMYRNVTGSAATALGLLAASVQADLPLFYASYPITPASELLHTLATHGRLGVRTLQAEDEIAAAQIALGASFGGHLGVTGTSGPGMDLKAETIGLAVTLELPLVVIDFQRAGPSTGMPTKTEAADLLMAMYGRHGESPVPVVAAYAPGHCFDAAVEAARIAVKYRTPVILLADAFLANSAEPWRIPAVADLPAIDPRVAAGPNHPDGFLPYRRDEHLARPWAIPGTPGLEHRIGGLEKQHETGAISYDGANHELMTYLRSERVARIADDIPAVHVDHQAGAELLVLGWGSTYGAIREAVARARSRGMKVAAAHVVHLNPLPNNLGGLLRTYRRVVVPECNTGQLARILRGEFAIDVESVTNVQGQPFAVDQLVGKIVAGP